MNPGEKMHLSIITVCFNASKTIQNTFDSVLGQSRSDIEHWIVDGASTDATIDLIKAYQEKAPYPVHYISEPDKGLYDAMNKGVNLAQGEYIHFLNADDAYANETILRVVLPKLKLDSVYYGNILMIESDGVCIRVGGPYENKREQRWPFRIHQPGLFVPKAFYEHVGQFDIQYRIAADYEMTLRLLEAFEIVYLDADIVKMPAGGLSDAQAIRGFKEIRSIQLARGKGRLGVCLDCVYLSFKYKIKQYAPALFKVLRRMARGNNVE